MALHLYTHGQQCVTLPVINKEDVKLGRGHVEGNMGELRGHGYDQVLYV